MSGTRHLSFPRFLALCQFLLALASAPPAAAQLCGSVSGYFVSFTSLPGDSPAIPADFCSDTFRCAAAQSSGPYLEKVDPGCDPEASAGCALRLRFPLEFRGNKQNIAAVGLSGAPTPVVYWFDGEADPNCRPWLNADCGQVSICGLPPFKIADDFIETWLQLGTATCSNPVPNHSGLFSILAGTCQSRFSCPKRTFDAFDVTPTRVKQALGCIEPPKDDCDDCLSCALPGVPAGGPGPRLGGEELGGGGGAYLYYAAGGVGHPGYPGTAAHSAALGRYWNHDYAERIAPFPDESRVFLLTRKGTFREWSAPDASGVYTEVSPSSEKRTLTWLGAGAGWTLQGLDGTVDLFDDSGLWLSRTDRNGNATVATYSGGELASVAFADGRREDFAYHPDGKLASIVEVGVDLTTTRLWEYTWSGDDLVRVDRADGSALELFYGEPGLPGGLTRIELVGTDGTSRRVVRGYEYSPQGRVTRTWRGDASPTGPDAVEVWALALDDPEEPTVALVTDPLGNAATYTLGRDTVSSNVKVLSVAGDCPACGLAPNSQLFYEDPAHPLLPTRIVDARGTTTVMSYDGSGMMTSRTEALGEPEERTSFWEYAPAFPALVTAVEVPSVAGGAALRRTDWLRDGSGNPIERTVSGVEAGSGFSLTTTTTFNAAGQPLIVDPPGHGTADRTTFTYDPARGSLVADSRTDPLVGTTTFGHDPFHRRTSITDPNGVESTTAYDPLDRVTEVRQVGANPPGDDLVTAHAYTVFGDLFRTTLPEGNVVEYGYDPAGRLLSVERKPDASTPGERVLYQLDAAGNRTLEQLQRWDPGAAAWVTFSSTAYEYSTRCQVDRIVQAPGSPEEAVTEFEYDCNGNLEAQWDPNHDAAADPPTTSYQYDALDRLSAVSQPWNPPGGGGGQAVTSYGYDVQDHLVSVTDAEGNTTSYQYSDRDLLTQEVSPVSGTTTHAYNEHGELVSTTDARGVTVTRTVDELGRVSFIDYPDDSLDTAFSYDAQPAVCAGASFPVGRLAAITRNGESIEYCSDRFGRTTRDGELTYAFDRNGNRTAIGYPGGVSAAYAHDFADREVSLTVTSPGGIEPVVSAATYFPSGPLSALALGSGVTETRAFDERYGPTGISLAGPAERTWVYTTDRVGNILEIVETAGCTPGPLILENQTVTTTETFVSCSTLEAGADFRVEAPGEVTFHAQGTIALKSGFSVGSGARFAAGSGTTPELSRRTYTYQAPQYFLTGADGPWGQLDWGYDRIGNRLSETRDGGNPDLYQYLTNGGGGNSPVLDQVSLGVGGTRDYTYGLAGHLEDVAAGANVIDFNSDAEGRLASTTRAAAAVSAAVSYDGRSFLRRAVEMAGDPPAEAASVEAVYDSEGLLHGLRRKTAPADPQELVVHFYLAGRPVAQLAIDGAGAETWSYLTTDHLGTPLLATDDAGAVTWEGGFEPFGRDYQAGTPGGALENGVYLRHRGQWQDSSWADATSGAGITYNVMRWLEPGTGRYTRPDPLGLLTDIHLYAYVRSNPVRWFDPLGLKKVCCEKSPQELLERAQDASQRADDLRAGKGLEVKPGSGPIATTICGAPSLGVPGDPTTFFDPVRFPPLSPCEKECTRVHEASHARICREFGILISVSAQNTDEALAYRTEAVCLLRAASKRSIDVDEEFPDLRPIPVP